MMLIVNDKSLDAYKGLVQLTLMLVLFSKTHALPLDQL